MRTLDDANLLTGGPVLLGLYFLMYGRIIGP